MDLHKEGHLVVATTSGRFQGSIPQYAMYIQSLAKNNPRQAMFEQMSTRLELKKPYQT